MSILLGAMLEAIGHSVRLVLTGSNPLAPDTFTHIYIEVFCRGRWVPLDATMPLPHGVGAAHAGEESDPDEQAVDGGVGDAARLYRTFARFDPCRIVRVRHRRVIPRVVVQLGNLMGLIYRSDKWNRGHRARSSTS